MGERCSSASRSVGLWSRRFRLAFRFDGRSPSKAQPATGIEVITMAEADQTTMDMGTPTS